MNRRMFVSAAIAGGPVALALPSGFLQAGTGQPVVIELFTSQGCSSCPPADALLAQLANQPNVVALAWHVDYWNNLGWRDPYASRDWTSRQRRYAALLRDEVYTPAMVINGTTMVVGSDRAAVQAAIIAPHSFSVSTGLVRSASGLIGQVGRGAEIATVSLVVYDSGHATDVKAGENAGRLLRDVNVVRSVVTLDPVAADIRIPPDVVSPHQGAALLVQDRDGSVLGAASVRPASVTPASESQL